MYIQVERLERPIPKDEIPFSLVSTFIPTPKFKIAPMNIEIELSEHPAITHQCERRERTRVMQVMSDEIIIETQHAEDATAYAMHIHATILNEMQNFTPRRRIIVQEGGRISGRSLAHEMQNIPHVSHTDRECISNPLEFTLTD